MRPPSRWLLPLTIALVLSSVGAAVASGQVRTQSGWSWTPGLCKSSLQKYGMRLADGRTFAVQLVYCVGKGGPATCRWNSNYTQRLYSQFAVFARSYDGVVRVFFLHPTGAGTSTSTGIKSYGGEPVATFERQEGSLAFTVAHNELAKGCASHG